MPIFKHVLFLFVLCGLVLIAPLVLGDESAGEEAAVEKPPKIATALRLADPDQSLEPDAPNLVRVEAQYGNSSRWVEAIPDTYRLTLEGDGTLLEDISRTAVNPVTVMAGGEGGRISLKLDAPEATAQHTLNISKAQRPSIILAVDPDQTTHAYTGVGAGVMFYDNQFNISNELFDWCFKDVDTQIVHVLIRPDFEPTNDNDDWQDLNNDAYDWSACERLFWILWHAKQRNPDLKVYACLYSPPAWMKANDDTAGDAGLKDGESYKLEMAEYVYAFLKHAAWKGTPIDYLCLFNEPDWPHVQDGTHYDSLLDLAQTQVLVSQSVNQLIAADPDFDHQPEYVFPETLGAGSITRAGDKSRQLAQYASTGALDDLAAWGVHDYWNTGGYWENRYNELRAFPGVNDKPIWMTEWAQRYPRGDLASSIDYANNILNALRLGASAWMAFEWVHPAVNQSGLISSQWGEGFPEKRAWRSKSYYAFKQIANTSPAGGECVQIRAADLSGDPIGRTIESLAIRQGNKLVVHLINDQPMLLEYNVALPREATLQHAHTTGPTTNATAQENPTAQGTLPGYTLLTLTFQLSDPE